MSEKKAPSPEQRKIVDPIGEIEKLARMLWEDAGSPSEQTWEDFWYKAEQRLTSAGSSYGSCRRRPSGTIVRVTPNMEKLIAQTDDLLLSVVAAALLKHLDEHETDCLGYLLLNYRFTFDSDTLGPLDHKQTGLFLAQISGYYPEALLNKEKARSVEEVPLEKRAQYWFERMREMERKDEPLTYADQNTILRLRDWIAAEPRTKQLEFLE